MVRYLERLLDFSLKKSSELPIFFKTRDGPTVDKWIGVRHYLNALKTIGKGWKKDQRAGDLAICEKRVKFFDHVPLVIFNWDIRVQNKKFEANQGYSRHFLLYFYLKVKNLSRVNFIIPNINRVCIFLRIFLKSKVRMRALKNFQIKLIKERILNFRFREHHLFIAIKNNQVHIRNFWLIKAILNWFK